ncbi:hypothetical protein [Capnocytophaga canis]|uniref:hypothetical protein n=1 Tax=Capnocytophaga canis TaxID=1848903 RepID=UPI001562B4B3|nr:hypothetical protein [Capnocytophaga canis]
MKPYLTIFFVIICSSLNAQTQVLDKKNGQPIADTYVLLQVDGKNIATTKTDENGYFNLQIPSSLSKTKLIFTHLGYIDFQTENVSEKKYFLERKVYKLDDVTVTHKEKKEWLPFGFSTNLNMNSYAVTFIPATFKNKRKKITKLKYRLADFNGVKGLKYQPFKANLHSVDTLTSLPDKVIFQSEVIRRKDNKKWTVIDISNENITMPKEGIYVVLETLDKSYYDKNLYYTRSGSVIEPVPTLKMEPSKGGKKSFLSRNIHSKVRWEKQPYIFCMDIETEK